MNVVQASSLDRQDAHPTNQIRLLYYAQYPEEIDQVIADEND